MISALYELPDGNPMADGLVAFPLGLFRVLLDAAQRAGQAGLLGDECSGDPCPVCAALCEGAEVVRQR